MSAACVVQQGEQGERGAPADNRPPIIGWKVDTKSFRAVPFGANDKPLPALDLRPLFQASTTRPAILVTRSGKSFGRSCRSRRSAAARTGNDPGTKSSRAGRDHFRRCCSGSRSARGIRADGDSRALSLAGSGSRPRQPAWDHVRLSEDLPSRWGDCCWPKPCQVRQVPTRTAKAK